MVEHMKATVISNDGEVAILQLENGLRMACPRERSIDYNEVGLRALSREEFLQDMAVGVVNSPWCKHRKSWGRDSATGPS